VYYVLHNGHHQTSAYDTGSQDANDEFSKLSAHEARQRLAILLRHMDTNGDSLISHEEISEWVLNNFRSVHPLMVFFCNICNSRGIL